jgi:hypothetical protein
MGEARQLAWWTLLVMAMASVAFALIAYGAGQDANWDFYNYHFYNAYAFLNDRFWFDIAPAQRQTFFSPIMDVPFFWLTQAFGVVTASLGYAVFQAWQAPAVFLIAYLVIDGFKRSRGVTVTLSLALTVLAVFAPLNLQLAGTTTGDNTTAVFVLWAVACFMIANSNHLSLRGQGIRIALNALAALLAGLAVGLKLTNGPFAVALLAWALLIGDTWSARLRLFTLMALSSLLGFLLAYGYWGWFLYDQFQNPLFPLFNHLFQSEYMKPVQLNDETFKATSIAGTVFYPFLYNAYAGAIKYQQFLDLRIPVLYVSTVVAGASLLFSPNARRQVAEKPLPSGMLLFVLVCYVTWLLLFSITRYLVVLEVLTPVAVVVAASIVFRRKWGMTAAILLCLLTVALSSWQASQRGHAFGHRTAWTETVFEIDFPEFDIDGSMVLITGGQAMAFLIPEAPENTRFVRIDSNLNYVGYSSVEERYQNRLGERLAAEVGAHDGEFFIMYADGEEHYAGPDLAYFGIERYADTCRVISSKGPDMNICRAGRFRKP